MSDRESVNIYLRYSHLGMTFAIVFGAFLYSGYLLDQFLETSPIFILVGAVLGAIGSFYYLVKNISQMSK